MFFTAVNPMDDNQGLEEVQHDQDKPRIAVYKNTWTAQQNTVCWCNLKLAQTKRIAVLSNSIACNHSFFGTHNLRFVLRKWYTWKLERIYNARYINLQSYRASYSRQTRNMDVKILLISKRENPPTITRNKACSTGKPVAQFSKAHVASIPKKASDVCTRKPVAVTLTIEFQVHLTLPSRKKVRIVRKPSKDWFNSSRIIRTGIR